VRRTSGNANAAISTNREAFVLAAQIDSGEEMLLRQLATMNLDIAKARQRVVALRLEFSDVRRPRLLKQLEERLHEMLIRRESIMAQLNGPRPLKGPMTGGKLAAVAVSRQWR
jgi:hypothetical protein